MALPADKWVPTYSALFADAADSEDTLWAHLELLQGGGGVGADIDDCPDPSGVRNYTLEGPEGRP